MGQKFFVINGGVSGVAGWAKNKEGHSVAESRWELKAFK
jgi:hypothetical protein